MKKNSFVSKALTITAAFGIAATAFSTQSFAASSTTAITGGSLSGGEIYFTNFDVTLDGSRQIATTAWSIDDIIDARGTGTGWNLSLNLSQFKEFNTVDGAYVTDGKSLANSSLEVTAAPTVSQIDNTSSLPDTVTPVTVGTALDTELSIKLLSASEGGGMGSFSVSDMGLTLTIPANAYATTYKSEATVTLNTAP